jgi:hypothetical protein
MDVDEKRDYKAWSCYFTKANEGGLDRMLGEYTTGEASEVD